jgi:hypothetical protein
MFQHCRTLAGASIMMARFDDHRSDKPDPNTEVLYAQKENE